MRRSNNFILGRCQRAHGLGVTNYFYFVNDPTSTANGVFATNLNTGDIALDSNPQQQLDLSTAAPCRCRQLCRC